VSRRALVLVGLLVALVLAGGVSYWASSAPDGLNKVAADQGFDKGAEDHRLDDSPLAGYETDGVGDSRLSGGLAGVVGVAVTFLIVGGLVWGVRRRHASTDAADATTATETATDGLHRDSRQEPARP
jgi:cobalt/nickel transport system permease protein